jgi:hypothetical protein
MWAGVIAGAVNPPVAANLGEDGALLGFERGRWSPVSPPRSRAKLPKSDSLARSTPSLSENWQLPITSVLGRERGRTELLAQDIIAALSDRSKPKQGWSVAKSPPGQLESEVVSRCLEENVVAPRCAMSRGRPEREPCERAWLPRFRAPAKRDSREPEGDPRASMTSHCGASRREVANLADCQSPRLVDLGDIDGVQATSVEWLFVEYTQRQERSNNTGRRRLLPDWPPPSAATKAGRLK